VPFTRATGLAAWAPTLGGAEAKYLFGSWDEAIWPNIDETISRTTVQIRMRYFIIPRSVKRGRKLSPPFALAIPD